MAVPHSGQFILFIVFFAMVGYLYAVAEEEAYETLHMQTKQIKDDLSLQLKSDRENLSTMANFASKLYLDFDCNAENTRIACFEIVRGEFYGRVVLVFGKQKYCFSVSRKSFYGRALTAY